MEKKDYVIVVVCSVLLFLWFANQPTVSIPEPTPNTSTTESQTQDRSPEIDPPAAVDIDTISTPHTDTDIASTSSVLPPEYASLPPANPITLKINDSASITISPQLGGITSISLFKYHDKDALTTMKLGNESRPMHEIQDMSRNWTFSNAKVTRVGDFQISVSRAVVGQPLIINQEWRLDKSNPYRCEYSVIIKNYGAGSETLDSLAIGCGALQPLETAKGFMGAGGMDQRVDLLMSGKDSPKTINVAKIAEYDTEDRRESQTWRHDWIAVQNKYFTSIVSGKFPFSGCLLATEDANSDRMNPDPSKAEWLHGYTFLPKTTVPPGLTREWTFDCFIGPKRYGLLKELGGNQESVLQFDLFMLFHFDWMKGISLGILWGLNRLESIFNNYGIAIIIITLIIRTVFWPITHQSTVWSKKNAKNATQAPGNSQQIQERPAENATKNHGLLSRE